MGSPPVSIESPALLSPPTLRPEVKPRTTMRLVLLTHPPTFGVTSISRFAEMIARGMSQRGYEVETWTSGQKWGLVNVKSPVARKWLGYVDQFLLYPGQLEKRVSEQSDSTVFVVADQALGMWVPYLARRPHVIHCHDFLALQSAMGEFPENPTGWTGRQYQRLIRKGFSHGNTFVSVSHKTRADLHRYLPRTPKISEVVYNGLNHPFRPVDFLKRMVLLKKSGVPVPELGFILHLSGNQWYKNPKGILAIYRAYVESTSKPFPLWMVGAEPSAELRSLAAAIPTPGRVQFVNGLSNEQVNAAYSHARVLLFPSIGEGFGWPIIEAMASACPVITTDAPPMSEIAGDHAHLIPRMPSDLAGQTAWAKEAAAVLDHVVNLNGNARADLLREGALNAARFDAELALDAYEEIYARALTA